MMRTTLLTLAVVLLTGCAAQEESDIATAVQDFIAVAELEEQTVIRTPDQYSYRAVGDRHVILTTRKRHYLVQFRNRCRELEETIPEPDIRYDSDRLRVRFDTIRGCRIAKIYPIDEAQADELEYLGKAPGEKN